MSEEKFSYSKLDTYVQCPFKYYLKYVENHSVFSATIATEIGTLIHSTEEAIAKSIINKEEINYLNLKNNILINLFKLKEKYRTDFSEVDKSGRTYRQKIYYYLETAIYNLEHFMNEHPNYSIVGVEKYFEIEYQGKQFHGYIDRVFYDSANDKYLIQDIKTYAVEVEKSALATPLQFVIYTLAARELFNCTYDKIECQYYLPFCNLTQNAGTMGYLGRGTEKINKLFESIESQDYTPCPTALCNYCDFCVTNPNAPDEVKILCPYFSLWERTTRNKYDIRRHLFEWEGLDKHSTIMESYIRNLQEGGEQ